MTVAMEAVYLAFAGVLRPRKIEGCRCCIDDKEVWVLLSKPLREITAKELGPYAASALLTVGEPADYRYYLPRILEVSLTVPGWWPGFEVTGRAMRDAGWQCWSAAEVAALQALFMTLWELLIERGDVSALDSLLCGLAIAGADLRSWLDRLAASPQAALLLYAQNANELAEGRLANAFWDYAAPDQQGRVVDWFRRDPIRSLILESYGVWLEPNRA